MRSFDVMVLIVSKRLLVIREVLRDLIACCSKHSIHALNRLENDRFGFRPM
jgi:hypothetical protein